MTITDAKWDEILRATAAEMAPAREDAAAALKGYFPDESGVKSDTRKDLRELRQHVTAASRCARRLQNKPDYRHFRAAGNPDATSLAELLNALAFHSARLDQEHQRLSERSQKNWQRKRVGAFFIELLEIRSRHLGIDVPIQASETSRSGRFHKYLALFLELAEPQASKADRAKLLKAGIAIAIKSFQARRADPLYCWEWDDLFPQSEHQLFYPQGKPARFLSRENLG
jgi:hypothetical protein